MSDFHQKHQDQKTKFATTEKALEAEHIWQEYWNHQVSNFKQL
jgi:hypothetical protein